MKIINLIIASIIIPSVLASEQDFNFYRVSEKVHQEINDIFYSKEPVYFGFSATSDVKFKGDVQYKFDNKLKTTFELNLSPNVNYYFPNKEQQIILENVGEHSFYIKSDSKIIRQATILVEENKHKNTNSWTKLKTKPKASKNRGRIKVSRLKIAKKRNLHNNLNLSCIVLLKTNNSYGFGLVVGGQGRILTTASFLTGSHPVTAMFSPKNKFVTNSAEVFISNSALIHSEFDLAILEIRGNLRNCKPSFGAKIVPDDPLIGFKHVKGYFGDQVKEWSDKVKTNDTLNTPWFNSSGEIYGITSSINIGENRSSSFIGSSQISSALKELVDRSDKNNNLSNWKKLKFSSYEDDLGSNVLLVGALEKNWEPAYIRKINYLGQTVDLIEYENSDKIQKSVFGIDYNRDGQVDKFVLN